MASKEYIEFMLGKGGGKRGGGGAVAASISTTTTPLSSERGSIHKKNNNSNNSKSNRKAMEIVIANEWLHVDEQMEQVLGSIANLRDRIREISKLLVEVENTKRKATTTTTTTQNWKTFGYRKDGGGNDNNGHYLTREDLELALDHDLLQHERMMTVARQLLSQLGRAVEMMGRRLEELYYSSSSGGGGESEWVEQYQELYIAMGQELYRKQVLAQQVLDVSDDGLLLEQDTHGKEANDNVAYECTKKWKSNQKISYLHVYQTLLIGIKERNS